jgi:hypothetical protein
METIPDLNDPTNKAQRIQELVSRPEFSDLVREAIRVVQALPPQKRKQQKPRGPRSDEQIAKRHMQMLQRKSYVRASARAEAELRQKRTTGDVAALAQKRYKLLLIS